MGRRETIQPQHAVAGGREVISGGAAHGAESNKDSVVDHNGIKV